MKRILLPFESKIPAYRISFTYAAAIAMLSDSELIILISNNGGYESNGSTEMESIRIKSQWLEAIDNLSKAGGSFISGLEEEPSRSRLKLELRMVNGNFINEIRRTLQSERIDEVIVPAFSHDDSCNQRLRIIRRLTMETIQTSLMVTPDSSAQFRISNMMFLFSFHKLKRPAIIIDELNLYSELYHTPVLFTNIAKGKALGIVDRNLVRDHLKDKKHMFGDNKLHDVFAHELKGRFHQLVKDNNIQLLALAKHQTQYMFEQFDGEFFKKVCGDEGLPVLVLGERILVKSIVR